MIRRSTIFWTVLLVAVAVGLYVLKNRVHDLEDRLQRLNREIIAEQEAIHVLKAEWAYLNQPARLDDLARRHLGLVPESAKQVIDIADLPRPGELTTVADAPEKSPRKPTQAMKQPAARPPIPVAQKGVQR
jgi:cell division protein FtsL